MKKILVILGPTGSGKTELAKLVYDNIPSRIISIDSAMVYRGMDIGTAKPTPSELKLYPHDLVDVCDPLDDFSVADCVAAVKSLLLLAEQEDKLPILVGGSMMYHYILQSGMHVMPSSPKNIRQEVENEFLAKGLLYKWEKLLRYDPEFAVRVEKNDKQRIHRALELSLQGYKTTALQFGCRSLPIQRYEFLNFGLGFADRSLLYASLDHRFDQMLAEGFIEEVSWLIAKDNDIVNSAAFRSIGYRQIASYVLGEIAKDEAVRQSKTATRRFAKRQITWSKKFNFNDLSSLSGSERLRLIKDKVLEY